jgi:uncharacterized protein (TIGR03084 family)
MLAEIAAFDAEVSELANCLSELPEQAFELETSFRKWTINDVILHLYASDFMALASVQAPADYLQLRAEVKRQRDSGLSMIEESRLRFPHPRGRALLALWQAQAATLGVWLTARDPRDKLAWSGPSMSLRTFATARQMETWAHGQEIYDVLGIERVACDRIANIARLGVKTFAWSFSNRGLPVPPVAPYVRLLLPSGQVCEWGDPGSFERIDGLAEQFCQVVTQVRNVLDTGLSFQGYVARSWMQIAQCFAGAPADPPVPGTRVRSCLRG